MILLAASSLVYIKDDGGWVGKHHIDPSERRRKPLVCASNGLPAVAQSVSQVAFSIVNHYTHTYTQRSWERRERETGRLDGRRVRTCVSLAPLSTYLFAESRFFSLSKHTSKKLSSKSSFDFLFISFSFDFFLLLQRKPFSYYYNGGTQK